MKQVIAFSEVTIERWKIGKRLNIDAALRRRGIRTQHKNGALRLLVFVIGIVAGLLVFEGQPALAAAKTWTGTTSTDWNTAGNWSPNGVPANGGIL